MDSCKFDLVGRNNYGKTHGNWKILPECARYFGTPCFSDTCYTEKLDIFAQSKAYIYIYVYVATCKYMSLDIDTNATSLH